MQTSANIQSQLQLFTIIYKHLQTFTIIYKHLQANTISNKHLQSFTNAYSCKHLQYHIAYDKTESQIVQFHIQKLLCSVQGICKLQTRDIPKQEQEESLRIQKRF